MCSMMFIEALFVIAENKPEIPQRVDIENVVNLQNGVLFSYYCTLGDPWLQLGFP